MEGQCPVCGEAGAASSCPRCGAGPDAPPAKGVPLEAARERRPPRALWHTWRAATFAPNAFFPQVAYAAPLAWPLLYAVLFWLLAAVANAAIQQPLLAWLEPYLSYQARVLVGLARTSPEAVIVSFVAMPVLLIPLLFLLAGVFHGLLALAGGARGGYRVTLRAVCYAAGSAALWVVPGAGPVLAWVWWSVLLVVGLARAHGTERWRSAFAVILPAAACGGGLVALVLWAAAAMLKGANVG